MFALRIYVTIKPGNIGFFSNMAQVISGAFFVVRPHLS